MMRYGKLILLFFIALSLGLPLQAQKKSKENYKIIFELEGVPDTMLYITNYYGNQTYLRDSVFVNRKKPGHFVFSGTDTLKRGVYILASQNKARYFEFVVDSSFFFTVKLKEKLTPENFSFSDKLVFVNSCENVLFYDFTSYMGRQQYEVSQLRQRVREEQGKEIPDEEVLVEIQNALEQKLDSIQNFTKEYLENYPNYLFSKAQKLGTEIKVPSDLPAEEMQDSNWAYKYYLNHYWDNCDFTEDGLIYTPVYYNILRRYYENVLPPLSDSIIKYTDILLEKAKQSPEQFRFIIWYVSHKYERSQYVGHDAVFVHMILNYYGKGLCPWEDETVVENMVERAKILKNLLLGKMAPFLVMPDTLGRLRSNYELESKYTVMWFWDTDCSHCKKGTQILLDMYERRDSLKFDVYGVCVSTDKEKWTKYIRDNELPWINVGDNKANIDFREVYYIKSTPKIYVLDKDKRIIMKNIGAEDLEDFLIKYEQGLIKF